MAEADLIEDEDGIERLYLYFRLQDKENGGERHPLLRGAEQFQDVLGHFGPRVQGIAAHWVDASGLEDNIRVFNRFATSENSSLEEAARQTWTGRQAIKNGFTEVSVIERTGTPGHYRDVKVNFDRPRAKIPPTPPKLEYEMDSHIYKVSYARWTDEDNEGWAERIWVAGELVENDKTLDLLAQKGHLAKGFDDFNELEEVPKILAYFEGRYETLKLNFAERSPEVLASVNQLTSRDGVSVEAAIRQNKVVRLLEEKGFRVTELKSSGKPGDYDWVSLRMAPPRPAKN